MLEQIVYLTRLRGLSKKEAVNNAKKWLKRLEIDEYANRKLETLSKGNQQKVQLASTLACEPEIVILDEPFSGLDPVNSKILQDVDRSHKRRKNSYIFKPPDELCRGVLS